MVDWKTTVTGAAGGAATGAAAGPWGALVGAGMGAAGSFLGGSMAKGDRAGTIGAAAGGYMTKIGGIPSPFGPEVGARLGEQKRAEQAAQFPGTNPWERMGASAASSGQVQVAKQAGKIQKELQIKELQTREKVANIAAGAHIQASSISAAPAASRAPSQIRETDMRAAHQRIINKYLPEHERARITVAKWAQTGPALWNIMDSAEKGEFSEPGIYSTGAKITGVAALTAVGSAAYRRFMVLGKMLVPKGFGKSGAPSVTNVIRKGKKGKLRDQPYSRPPRRSENLPRPKIGEGSLAWKAMQQSMKKRKR